MVKLTLLTVLMLKSIIAMAKDPGLPPLPPQTVTDYGKLPDVYLGEQNPALSPLEKQALAIGNQWRSPSANQSVVPTTGPNGFIQFVFGATQPRIVCAVLQVCDIALQPGEQISGVNMGDTARWLLEPAVTGRGDNAIQHIIVKPLAINLNTNMVVTTDRRTYNIRLRSHRNEYMAQVSFVYPEEALNKWKHLQTHTQTQRDQQTLPETGEYLGKLNFGYTVSGNAPWKPVRVFNDGVKTVIQMPESLSQTEAPTLLAIREKTGLFADDEQVLVNYRVQSNRYIVDGLPDKVVLVAGVGSDQDKITIEREQTP
ncbi:MAG: P-type conjugative transfer protein TrbG [Methylobacter sp.]|nr:P-type conjugative transfer protein TrbG [Methylobacter sp.]